MARRRSRNIEIFNFSFLDILACTIGLLIFIMVMVFILQAGSPIADTEAIVRGKNAAARADAVAAERDAGIADALEKQLSQFMPADDHGLLALRDAARSERDELHAQLDRRTRETMEAGERLAALRRKITEQAIGASEARLREAQARAAHAAEALARARADAAESHLTFQPHDRPGEENASGFQVLHVDCRADKVVILELDAAGTARESGESPAASLAEGDSVFNQAVRKQRLSERPLVLFWVRPDGMETFSHALAALPEEVPRGFEPADRDWRFAGGGR